MPDEITWTVTEASGEVKRTGNVEKIQFIAQARTSAEMTDGQKEFIRLYNLMRNTLLKNGLMEDKQ